MADCGGSALWFDSISGSRLSRVGTWGGTTVSSRTINRSKQARAAASRSQLALSWTEYLKALCSDCRCSVEKA